MKKLLFVLGFIALLGGAISLFFLFKEETVAHPLPRSITALRLETSDPINKTRLTGRVTAWKGENLSFEIPGRIEWIIDKGSEIRGTDSPYSLLNGSGALVAKLEPEDYQLKLKSAQANLKTTQAQLNALKINVREVISSQLAAAKADLANASKEFERIKLLLDKQVISQKLFDTAETTFLTKQAKLSEVKALVSVKQAEMKAVEATLEQLKQAVADAELDLQRTKLRVSFPGQIASVSANIGANVKAGETVAQLVVLDPVSIKLNVSPELDRRIHFRQFVQVFPPGGGTPIMAMVNRKSAVADSRTHTFSLELLVRNKVVNVAATIPKALLDLPQITSVWPVGKIEIRGSERLVVSTECINSDSQGDYVWLVTNTSNAVVDAPVYTIKREKVTFAPGIHSFLGVYDYRILDDAGRLNEEDCVATGVPPSTKSGSRVVMIRKQRMFRPGDLVKVVLSDNQTTPGIYIPLKAISSNSLKHWVFKVTRLTDGSSVAKQVFIKTNARYGDWIRVDSPLLKDGDLLVYEGAHFIIPNERVNVKSIEKLSP